MMREKDNLPSLGTFEPRDIGKNKLSSDDEILLQSLEKKSKVELNDERVLEFLRCRNNPFYFIHNYVNIQEVGGEVLYTPDKMHNKHRRVIKSLWKYNKCIFMASRQLGKALSIDTPIPQPDGKWTTMEDIKIGDTVLDRSGYPTIVTAATDIMYDHTCYELEFDCGEKIIADEDHLWKIDDTSKLDERVLTTKDLLELKKKLAKRKQSFHIKSSEPIKNTKKEFLVDPYILGVWLGDGVAKDGSITISKSDYENMSKNIIGKGYKVSEYHPKKSAKSGSFTIYELIAKLEKLNLRKNKHIPNDYLSGSLYQRLQLVRGLMDTNGTCTKKGDCKFYQKNFDIIESFMELLASLGIKSRYRTRIIKEQKYYTVKFCTKRFYVFNLQRKRNRQKRCFNHKKNNRHYIKSIKKIDSVPVRCIQVDNEDKMFLCGKAMIPTHNSSLAAALIAHVMTFFPGTTAIIINMSKDAGLENVDKIRFILERLPGWMKFIPNRSLQLKTRIDMMNDSRVQVIYPSTIRSPDTLGRSLTVPILYVDEAAFIRHMDRIYAAAQPTLSTARQQAEKNGYPYFLLMTSTPNGLFGPFIL